MSDLKIAEFRERAEHGLDFPDLALIERRGRALHRRRVATVAGALALVVLAGGGIARLATDGTDAAPGPVAPPTSTPTTTTDQAGVHKTVDHLGEDVLLPGPSHVVYDGISVRFDVPGAGWEWWDYGTGLRRSADERDDYGAAVFFMREASARLEPCSDNRVEQLGSDPDRLVANVDPLLHLAHATVLQGPRVVTAFGGPAVHLRLETNGGCPDSGLTPAQLRGADDTGGPGFGGRHVLDVWNVVVPGPEPASMLVASWALDGTDQHQASRQALLDSLRIGVS